MATKPKKSAKKKSKAPKPRKPVEVKRKPRAQRLPGMEDAGFPELEKLAEEYADVRDQRMALTKEEKELWLQASTAWNGGFSRIRSVHSRETAMH